MTANAKPVDRPIRVLVAKPGLDGHDVGAKLVCRALRDAGMEVVYTGLRQSPEAIATTSLQERVDVVGLSILSGAHLPLCRKVAAAMKAAGIQDDVLWIVGGNIPESDHAELCRLGVARVFPTGVPFNDIAQFIRERARP
jgi:methylmalonyl-CoA mutase C-terminal domain/subunit